MLSYQERETTDVFEGNTGAFGNRVERVVGNLELDADFVGKTLVESAKQGAATCELSTAASIFEMDFSMQ